MRERQEEFWGMFTKEFMQQIDAGFEAQMARIGAKRAEVEAVLANCTVDEAEAMRCMYAGMPVSDAAECEPELLLKFAKHGVFLWEKGPFAGQVPEDIFAGYVLLHRVHNENITFSRQFFYDHLIEDIKGMTMEEAGVHVNYWCAAEATYQVTDGRTVSADTMFKSAYGRCGEESVYAVTIYRSVGIPARQVHVPLWSHCDDNHAWVEIWVDGVWKFLGACEPEEILNKSWFTTASSRAMMVQSRWFLPALPKEDIIGNTGMAQVLNQLNTYAYSMKLEVLVQDADGKPVPNAKIVFEVLNYSKMGEIATVYADENGKKVLETGKGCVHVTAFGNGAYGELLVNTQEQDSCTVVLGAAEQMDQWVDVTVVVPKDNPKYFCNQTEEEIEIGRQKFAAVTNHRLEKVANFYKEEVAEKAIVAFTEEEKDRCRDIMKKACGNLAEVADFLGRDTQDKWPQSLKLAILESIRVKDYTDITADILEAHCAAAAAYMGSCPEDIFNKYILCPRVDNETIHPFREFIEGWLTKEQKEEYRSNPAAAWKMVNESLISDPDLEYSVLVTSAKGALTSGYGSVLTKKTVTVQILRTLGVPARLNPADGMLEAWKDGEFVALEKKVDTSAGRTSAIIVHESEEVEWKYFQNWTIARFEAEGYNTLRLGRGATGGVFGEIAVFPGKYRVLTTNRLPNGNILAKKFVFELKDGEKKDLYLEQRQTQLTDLIEDYDVPDFKLTKEDGSKVLISELAKDQNALLMWLEESKEPTEHVLNEIAEKSEDYQQLTGTKLYFIIKDEKVKEDPTLKRTLSKMDNVEFLYDDFGADRETMARRMYVDTGKLPLIVLVNQEMKGIYSVAGYNVGTADMILRILNA